MKKQNWKVKFMTTITICGLVSASLASIGFAQGLKLHLGDSGPQVNEAEKMLSKLGYYVQVDTIFDSYTERAIKKFQTGSGLPVTGVLNDVTNNSLKQKVATYDSLIGKPAQQQPIVWQPAPQPKPTVVWQPAPQPKPTVVSQPAPQPPVTSIPGAGVGASLSAEEQNMVNLINQERAKQGLQPLQPNAKLMELARLKAQDMVARNYFSHTSPTYGSPFEMMRNAGVVYTRAGENIAGNRSVAAAHVALMNSSGHRANILNTYYNQVGIGIAPGGPYGTMYVQMFIQQ